MFIKQTAGSLWGFTSREAIILQTDNQQLHTDKTHNFLLIKIEHHLFMENNGINSHRN